MDAQCATRQDALSEETALNKQALHDHARHFERAAQHCLQCLRNGINECTGHQCDRQANRRRICNPLPQHLAMHITQNGTDHIRLSQRS
ncbi:hypothetical protein [Xanthomonas sp. 3075]|uniref:hypothetical protein n=1 Tax=Xanthomonas sp. 3075 TaxID=3035315 RepID=UPI001615DCA7|nr:hypothetical protein [Xanthomonas sp. 3075]MBB4129758.1 hypothetical protein [Xanthomonas sp. 3075]